VLKVRADALVDDARVAAEELVVEEFCQQIPSEDPQPGVSAFREPQEPAERFELL
jgi:hypothetical protein